jgi:RNA polymerase sigma-70 factor (ECF subfamily)
MQNRSYKFNASSDKDLVADVRRGNRDAFDELVGRHHHRCMNLAASMLRDDPSEGEDEVQNACWKAFERLDQYRGESDFQSWLLRIVKNQCLTRLRQRRRARLVPLVDLSPQRGNWETELLSPEQDPERALGDRQLGEVVRKEIQRIPAPLRNVIVRCDLEGLPISLLAAQMGITVMAAKSRLWRARLALRRSLVRRPEWACHQPERTNLNHRIVKQESQLLMERVSRIGD